MEVLLVLRAAHVGDRDAGEQRGGDELRVVIEELMQAVDDVQAMGGTVQQHDALGAGEKTVGGCDSADEVIRGAARVNDGFCESREDRDAVGETIEQRPGVRAGMTAVDDAEDVIFLGVADQTVGRLAILLAELGFAVDDRGGANRQVRGRGMRVHGNRVSSVSDGGGDGERIGCDSPLVDKKSSLKSAICRLRSR